MARPKLDCERVEIRVHLWLRTGEDDDLIEFFSRVPVRERANALKVALRAGGMQSAAVADAEESNLDDLVGNLLM